jgi:hypothetical protein
MKKMKNNFVIVEPVFRGMEYKLVWVTSGKEVIITQGYDIDPDQAHVGCKVIDHTVVHFICNESAMDIAESDSAPVPMQLLLKMPSFVKHGDEIKIILEYENKKGDTVVIEGIYENDSKKPSVALLGIQGVSVEMTQTEVADAYQKYVNSLETVDDLV